MLEGHPGLPSPTPAVASARPYRCGPAITRCLLVAAADRDGDAFPPRPLRRAVEATARAADEAPVAALAARHLSVTGHYSRLVKTPTKRTCGFSCDFHSSIAAGRDTIGDRITVEDAIGTTLVHSVNPSNSWLSINLSTGTQMKIRLFQSNLPSRPFTGPVPSTWIASFTRRE